MKKSLFGILLTTTLLSGCQQTISQVSQALKPIECSFNNQQLADLIDLEHHYNSADQATRQTMLEQTLEKYDSARSAILLSASGASLESLEKARTHYRRALHTPPGCSVQSYLELRQQQTLNLIAQHQEQQVQQDAAKALQKKIDALTGLENELSSPRSLTR